MTAARISDLHTSTPRNKLTALRRAALAAAIALAPASITHASGIFGTLSNFDIYFTPPSNPMDPNRPSTDGSEGAEIELEGIHSSSVGGGYPAHYARKTITEYNETDSLGVVHTGTRIKYTGYNFAHPNTLRPNLNPTSTNGHQLTNSAGGEHFGFWLGGLQPTAQRFFWLDKVDLMGTDDPLNYMRIEKTPVIVPGPMWHYVPPVPNPNPNNPPIQPPMVQAVIQVPEPVEPPEVPEQRPDSTWVKVYKVKLDKNDPNVPHDAEGMQKLLEKLISDANPGNDVPDAPMGNDDIVPEGEDPAEVETEWELLEGGKNIANKEKMDEDPIDEDMDRIIIRRYEFFEYRGNYDAEHEAFDPLLDTWDLGMTLDPNMIDDGMGGFGDLVGKFISANMVAAVLNPIPEPATFSLLLAGTTLLTLRRRSRP